MRIGLAANWWALVIRGLVAIAFGGLTFVVPGLTLAALVFLFAGYSLVDGVFNIIGAVRAIESHQRWGVQVFEGIVGIGAAVVTVFWPAITALALVFVIAVWAIATGVAEIVAAIRLRRHIRGEWLLILSGILSVAFGILLVFSPMIGAFVITLWIGAYALLFGIILVALGVRMRSWGRGITSAGGPIPVPVH